MKILGIVFLFSGINLMGLSGLEKVLIFLAYNGDIHQMQAVINLNPNIYGILQISPSDLD